MHSTGSIAAAAVALATFETSAHGDRTSVSPAIDLPTAAPLCPIPTRQILDHTGRC